MKDAEPASVSESLTLDDSSIGETVIVSRIDLPNDVSGWLAGVGLIDGEEVTLLRRGLFGGPLHVRLTEGGELAVARDVARHILVKRAP